ncbi:hypothetical protein AN958_08182, partial [Leucoagaricus sp. SymC.cos]
RKVVCLSIVAQSNNMHCNALQTLVGVFMQACDASEAIRDFLSRVGLSISVSGINNVIDSLSKNATTAMKAQGQTLLTLFSFNNLDMVMKHSVPILNRPQNDQEHLTTGTMVVLHPQITTSQLRPSSSLWSSQIPNRALDIAPSTPAANAEVMLELFKQAGIGDPLDHLGVVPIGDHAVLVSGDLLTGEHIRSLLETQSEEATAWWKFSHIVFVPGLFHFKMACADALWHIFIYSKGSQADENSLMEHLGKIRPKETRKFASVGQLDGWRSEVLEHFATRSLEECLKLIPSGDDLQALCEQPDLSHDKNHENILLRHQMFLLYEEITHAMNYGDIGRLEHAFPAWSFIFQACGKHKYAAELMWYLTDVHFRYPDGIKEAVCYNILINPTGKDGHWRGIDWLIEHNNLYTKFIYGGHYSNNQKSRILKESTLIEVYKANRWQLESMFSLSQKATKHAQLDMTDTFQQLSIYMETHKTNEIVLGRGTKYVIPDMMGKGMHIAMSDKGFHAMKDAAWETLLDELEVEEDIRDLEV